MAKKTVLIRVVEWTAFVPQRKDSSSPLMLANGITGFEIDESERVVEVSVGSTGHERHFPMEIDGEQRNIRHTLYAFQALLAATADELPESLIPDNPDGHTIVLPGQPNRAQRRNGGK